MASRTWAAMFATLALGAGTVVVTSPAADGAATGVWKNCTHVNQKYPHGVGKAKAHDHTSGTPVTNFKHSTALYHTAMNHNLGLDRDKDGIACEKA